MSSSTETTKEESGKDVSLKDSVGIPSCYNVEQNEDSFIVFTFCLALNLSNFRPTLPEEKKSESKSNKKQASKSTNSKKEPATAAKISNEMCYISCTYSLTENETTTMEVAIKDGVGLVFSNEQTNVVQIWKDKCSSWLSWTCRHKIVGDEESLKDIANREIVFSISNEQDTSNSRVSLEAIETLLNKDADEMEVLKKEIEKEIAELKDDEAEEEINAEERLKKFKEDKENQVKIQTEMTESRVRLLTAILREGEEDDDDVEVGSIKTQEKACKQDPPSNNPNEKKCDKKAEKKPKECKYEVIRPVIANFYCEKFNENYFKNRNENNNAGEECSKQHKKSDDRCKDCDRNNESRVFSEKAYIKSRQTYKIQLDHVKSRKEVLKSPHLLPPHLRTDKKESVEENSSKKKNDKNSKKKKSAKKEAVKEPDEEKKNEPPDEKEKLTTSITLAPFYTRNSLLRCVVRRAVKSIDSKACNNIIEDFIFKANLEGTNLLNDQQLCSLNPMLISLTSLHNLPSPCLPSLHAFYKPVVIEYSIFGLKYTSRSFPHFKNTRLDDHFVVFLGDVDGGVVKEFCWGKGIEICVHDRNVRDEMKVLLKKDVSLYGGCVDDPIFNHYFFAHYKRSLEPWKQPSRTIEPHNKHNDSVVEKNIKGQKKEQEEDKTIVNIPAPNPDENGGEVLEEGGGRGFLSLYFLLKGGACLEEAVNIVSSGNKKSFIASNYLCSECKLNIKVELLHPWAPCCDIENPISRFLIHFKSENKNFYTNLLSFVLSYNLRMAQSKCGKENLQSFVNKEEKTRSSNNKEENLEEKSTKDSMEEDMVYVDGCALLNTITVGNVDFYKEILDAQHPSEENNLDYITGFCVDDGSMGVVVLEGQNKSYIIHRLREMVEECCEEEPNLSYNTSITFNQRLYTPLNLGLRTLKTHLPIPTILSHHLCHLPGTFSPDCYEAIMKLYRLQQTCLLTQVVRNNDFPSTTELLAFYRELCRSCHG